MHLAVIVLLVTRVLPRDWPGLNWRIFKPAIICGQQSLQVFATGIFLSFIGYFVLVEVSNAIWMQILVSVTEIVLLCILAWYRSWTISMDKPAGYVLLTSSTAPAQTHSVTNNSRTAGEALPLPEAVLRGAP